MTSSVGDFPKLSWGRTYVRCFYIDFDIERFITSYLLLKTWKTQGVIPIVRIAEDSPSSSSMFGKTNKKFFILNSQLNLNDGCSSVAERTVVASKVACRPTVLCFDKGRWEIRETRVRFSPSVFVRRW